MIVQQVDLNTRLKIDWKDGDRYSLTSLVDPDLPSGLISNRAAELEDLFRKLFHQDSIRVHRQLWHDAGRAALAVFAFDRESAPEASIVVCGRRDIIEAEARRFRKFSPRMISETGTAILKETHTLHFAANQYGLGNCDLESARDLATLFRMGLDKPFQTAVESLFSKTLHAWHQDKRVRVRTESQEYVPSGAIARMAGEDLEVRARAIEDQISTMGFLLERSGETLAIRQGSRSYAAADPSQAIPRLIARHPLVLGIRSPGKVTGESVLADNNGQAWVTDFAQAGLVPPGWDFVSLETALRFDWLEIPHLVRRFELEVSLVNTDFRNPDTRDLDPACRRSAHAIARLRRLYTEDPRNDPDAYHYLVFLQALSRFISFDPARPQIGLEIVRMGQIWLALGILAAKLEKSEGSVGTQAPREIQIRDRQARLLRIGEREVSLAPQPFCLLAYLYDNPGRVCTHEELIAKVFHGKYDAEYLHSLIGRIRKAIGDDAKHPDHLITIPNTGYRLILKP
jgi:hypothetical protein